MVNTGQVRVAIYTRLALRAAREDAGQWLDSQRAECAAYVAQKETWALIGTRYDDLGASAISLERPAFQRLLVDIEAGEIDVVVVPDLGRLSRSREDLVLLARRFEDSSVAFVSAAEDVSIIGAAPGVPVASARASARSGLGSQARRRQK